MHISFLLLTTILSVPQQSPAIERTYKEVLGEKMVKTIVIEVLCKKVADSDTAYSEGVPKSKKLEYDVDFVTAVTERILQAEVPLDTDPRTAANYARIDPKSYAEKRLREGFGRFADNIVAYFKEKIEGPTIRLTKQSYEEYMTRPQDLQKCGEIPCNQPPCCRYCAPPPCKPSATSWGFSFRTSSAA